MPDSPSRTKPSLHEPCPWCDCPGERFDGHACEDFSREPWLCPDCYRTHRSDEPCAPLVLRP